MGYPGPGFKLRPGGTLMLSLRAIFGAGFRKSTTGVLRDRAAGDASAPSLPTSAATSLGADGPDARSGSREPAK